MFNNVILIGRLTATPERKATESGTSVTSFRIAVDRRFTDKDGNRTTDFFTVVAWSGTAEFICKYFTKGSMIGINGEMRPRSWDGKDGHKHYTNYVLANEVFFVGSKRDFGRDDDTEESAHGVSVEEAVQDDGDLPF